MGKYLDSIGLANLIGKIKTALGLKADKTAFSGSTTSAAGTMGLVPAPTAGSPFRTLGADGNWKTASDVTLFGIGTAIDGTGYMYWDGEGGLFADDDATMREILNAQEKLVSGTNIKTINNQSLLGSGNITISGGGSIPSGGMQGAVLAKASATDGDVTWAASTTPFKVYASSPNTNQTFCGFRSLVADDLPDLSGIYLPLSGGTVDGSVEITKFLNTHEAISMICDTVDSSASNNGVTSIVYRSLGFRDSAERYMGYIQLVAATSGYSQMEFSARKLVNGSNIDNAIRLRVAADGSRVVSVSAPAEWRAALGFNTWTNVSISNFATAASGWSFVTNECKIQYNEALGALRCRIRLTTSAAQTAGQKTVFTVAAAYRPKTLPASLSSLVSNAQAIQIFTTGGAAVNVSALSANASLYFNGVYFIGA